MKIFSLWYEDFAHLDKVFPEAKLIGPHHTSAYKIEAEDIVIFHGGTDISAHLYGEVPSKYNQYPDHARDTMEVDMYNKAQAAGAFCYGICRGSQLLCVANGGKLIQHIHDDSHRACSHEVTFTDGNKYYDRPIKVNSDHHQAMIPVGDHELIAHHKDIPEIVWYPTTRSFCVQGHPEWLSESDEFVQFVNNFIKSAQ